MKKNINKNIFYALDIGSRKMTLAAAATDASGALSPVLIETQKSVGIFKGVVNDLVSLSDAVSQLFKKMEVRLGAKASHVALSINGNYINARHSQAAVALSDRGTRSITRRDIEKLNAQARTLGMELDEQLLHEYPQGYSIDRHNMTLNPIGLHGRRFDVDMLLVCANTGYVENIARAVEQAGLDVANVVFSGVAASEAVLSDEEKEKGVVLVDIGDALTSVLIFKDGVVRSVSVLSFGGKNLSEIIANYCSVPLETADKIKETSLEVGHDIPETEEVMIKIEYAYKPVKKQDLSRVCQPEIDRFIAMLKGVIFESKDISLQPAMPVVVIGGLSQLEGLLEKMEHDLGLSVNMGLAKGLGDISPTKASAYASALGLLYLRKDYHLGAALKLKAQGKNKLAKALDYVTNLYQDYF
ncbi:MAG: cell division protein FtsA [Candidatus Omnitrophica bacterium CG1_02_44_16]|nr:MAG: cell division protein FtsA [Candidatus Omnitrophica bacterium CG1_02_44_16]PIY83667.1 MAG: cell division protein FtsA [Candidatus Omnitrophica bacterium CG_4_10_14_0_8_um_filter_44_12]PIZ84435.1 MAG: cell division protein FtsA [Candidatus Omnitrophica bacterium CG_4_10_14_0_2_um_filter_44_9]